jgi:hypothetical protein
MADASTTHEMLCSEDPCAIEMMLMPSRPKVLNARPAMPGEQSKLGELEGQLDRLDKSLEDAARQQ